MRKKYNLNMIIAILVIIILIGFIWGYNVLGIRTTITKGVENLKGLSSNVNVQVECPEGIIPSEIDLIKEDKPLLGESGLSGFELSEGQQATLIYRWDPEWLDGQKMTMYPPASSDLIYDATKRHCFKSSEEGKNINYYYCDVGYSKTTTDISDEGVIGETKTISYKINLVLEKKEHIRVVKGYSLDTYNVVSSSCVEV